jgi:hypothetical protein
LEPTEDVGGRRAQAPNVRHQLARLERADRRMRPATRVDLPLILFAGLTMAVGRYL